MSKNLVFVTVIKMNAQHTLMRHWWTSQFIGMMFLTVMLGLSVGKVYGESFAEPHLTDEERVWIEDHPVIHLSGGIFPPLDGKDATGAVKGMGRAYTDLIGRKLGIRFEHSAEIWADVLEQAKREEIDGIRMLIPNLERDAYLNFTQPYSELSYGLVIRESDESIITLEALVDKRLAALEASYDHGYVAERYPGIQLVSVNSYEAGIDAVFNGEVEAFIGALLPVDHIIRTKNVPGLRVTSLIGEFPAQQLVMGIREGWPEFIPVLNKAIASITPAEHAAIEKVWQPEAMDSASILLAGLSEQEMSWLDVFPELSQLASRIRSRVQLSNREREWLATKLTVPVRVGDYPPFHFVEEDIPQGLSLDYVKAICLAFDLECDFVTGLNIARSITSMQQPGGIAIQPAWHRNAERQQVAIFTQPYITSPFVIFQRQGGESILGMEDLVDKRVVVEKNYVIHKMLKQDYPELRLLEVDFSSGALQALADGRADAYISSLMAGHYLSLIHGIPNIEVAAPAPFKANQLEIAIRKDWPELASIVDKSLTAIQPEEHKIIRDRWLSVKYEVTSDYELIWKIVLLAVIGLLLFVTWNVSLKRTVSERTSDLIKSESYYRSIFDNSLYAIALTGPDMKFQQVNSTFCQMMGYSEGELIDIMGIADVSHPDSIAESKELVGRLIMKEIDHFIVEKRYVTKAGRVLDCVSSVKGIYDGQGEFVGSVASILDVSERKLAEKALRDAEEKVSQQREYLERLSRIQIVDEMATTFAHDLNQPLAAISSYAQACHRRLENDANNTEKLKELMGKIDAQATRASDVIEHLRALVKKQKAKKTMFDINGLCEETIGLVEHETALNQCQIELVIMPGMPKIEADHIQIQQVILNLVLNSIWAVSHVENETERQIVIQTKVTEDNEIKVSVADNGSGVSASDVEELFKPFFTTKAEGMGIGLSICLTIIEAHGGKIWYTPNPEGGAIFSFTLPLKSTKVFA